MTTHGVDRGRVAELIVTHRSGRRRGSGYRVTTTSVLTAAHVLAGAVSVQVRFEPDLPGQWSTAAMSWWSDPASDVAVVSIAPRPDERPVGPARFGRIGERAAVVAVHAVGFPLWKMRSAEGGERYRDAHHAVGSLAVFSNWREGTLEVTVSAAPEAGGPSPWEGMSGAALWAGDRVVGVISEHHRGDGLARLAAARLDLLLDRLDGAEQGRLRELLPMSHELFDILPSAGDQRVSDAYRAFVTDIAPDTLSDREQELHELVRFCAGDEAYGWWQAEPWAGKSALLSWFALRPPAGVEVVSYFVTSRIAGQSDSETFVAAVIEQLAALVGEQAAAALESPARQGNYLRLLQAAATRCTDEGRRLLLIVDGLDEDTSKAAGVDRPSIASLLPRRPPPGLRVLIASRPSPRLPDDVPADHPLRATATRALAGWPHARDVERAAKHELTVLLAGPALQRDLLGLIAASGGGLTMRDLEELLERDRHEVETLLSGSFGRTVGSRALGEGADPVFLFTHDTLRVMAEDRLSATITRYRDRLHTWAETYRRQGWPPDTPRYLLHGYTQTLAAGDLPRLISCAIDRARHDRMLEHTGGDALALAEINTTAELLSGHPDPDLASLVLLQLARDDLTRRNSYIADTVPALWARLGRHDRAVALARGLPGGSRGMAWYRILAVLVDDGDIDQAVRLTLEIEDGESRAQFLCRFAERLTTDHPDRAIDLISAAQETVYEVVAFHEKVRLLCALVERWAAVDDVGRATSAGRAAEIAADQIDDPLKQMSAWGEISAVWAAVRNDSRAAAMAEKAAAAAAAIAGEINFPGKSQLNELAALVGVLASSGHRDHATSVADQIETTVRAIDDLDGARPAAKAWAAVGAFDRAELFARESSEPQWALNDIAMACAVAGKIDRAERLADELESSAVRARVLCTIAQACVVREDHERADALTTRAEIAACEKSDGGPSTGALAEVGTTCLLVGGTERAERFARGVRFPVVQVRMLCEVAVAWATAGSADRASAVMAETEVVARGIRTAEAKALSFCEVTKAWVTIGNTDRAVVAAAGAEAAAREIAVDPHAAPENFETVGIRRDAMSHFELTLLPLTTLLNGDKHEYSRRELFASRSNALCEVAHAWASVGHVEHAVALATEVENMGRQASSAAPERGRAVGELVAVLATGGDPERAERLARTLDAPDSQGRSPRVRALLHAAAAWASAGDRDRAVAVVGDAERCAGPLSASDMATLAAVLAASGELARAEGVARAINSDFEERDARARALGDVAVALAATGDPRAVEVASEAQEGAPYSETRAVLARAWAIAGHPDWAELVAARMYDSDLKAQVLVEVARAWVAAGDVERAEGVACGIDSHYWSAAAVGEVAGAWIVGGNIKRGVQLAELAESYTSWISKPDLKNEARSNLGVAIVGSRRFDGVTAVVGNAEKAARRIVDVDVRARALGGVVRVWTALGEGRRGLEIATEVALDVESAARDVHDPDKRVVALGKAALAWLATEDRSRAAAAVVDAMSEARSASCWTAILPVVARVDLPALQSVADVLSEVDSR